MMIRYSSNGTNEAYYYTLYEMFRDLQLHEPDSCVAKTLLNGFDNSYTQMYLGRCRYG